MAEYISFQPSDYFNPVLYTGNASTQTITGVGFSADFTWMKNRDSTSTGTWHNLVDTVRGYNKYLYSNSNSNEETNTGRLTSWNSDGFALGSDVYTNKSSDDYVSWNWKAGTTTGIDTTGSTITPSSYSFNATSGFSVIAYTGNSSAGALVPHGLGVAPKLIIVKRLDSSNDWTVYHEANGNTKYMVLSDPDAAATSTTRWNDTTPTSTLFSLGTSNSVNSNTNTFIAYCFADVKGFSKFGSFTGNSNADGAFVYTGFSPAYVLIKNPSSAGGAGKHWLIHDNKQSLSNPNSNMLLAESNAATNTWAPIDLLSNGFKIRTDNYAANASNIMVYMAFAEFPIVSSNDVPTVAR